MRILFQFHALLPPTLFYYHRSAAHNIIIHHALGSSKLASSEPRLSEYLSSSSTPTPSMRISRQSVSGLETTESKVDSGQMEL